MSTAKVQTLVCNGMWTDPNPHANAPPGAMDVADNVVFRRPGTAELRPGFMELASDRVEFSGFNDPDGMFAFGGDLIVQPAGDGIKQYIAAVSFVDEFNGVVKCPPTAVRGQDVGAAFYVCANDNVRKLYAGTSRTARAGVLPPYLMATGLAASGSAGAVQPLSFVAYVGLLKIVYADERTVTSGISGRTVIYNDDATDTVSPLLRLYLPAGLDVVAPTAKIFAMVARTKNSTVYPPEEYFLAYDEIEVTSTHITNGFVGVSTLDTYQDARLGQALYFNPSRETPARLNALPPAAQDLQIYAGSMFAGRLTYHHRKKVQWTLAGGTSSQTGSVTGIGSRTDGAVGTTQDSADLTGVTTTGLQVGMLVSVEDQKTANPGAPLTIAALPGGGVVTLSEPLTGATNPSTSATFYDAVHISFGDDLEIFPVHTADAFMRAVLVGYAGGVGNLMEGLSEGPYTTASEILRGFVLGDVQRFTQQTAQSHLVNLFIELLKVEPLGIDAPSSFTVAATHGDEFTPPLALPTVAETDDWSESERPATQHAVTWSKNGEYEHFLEGLYEEIGISGIPLLRIFSTLDGLWCLKGRGDGIYRLTGFGERTRWRVEQVSKTCALIHECMACSDGRSVYAWTNEGAVRIDAGGVHNLSVGVIGVDFERDERTSNVGDQGWFCAANTKSGEILWGISAGSGNAREILVWNTRTEAWSRWFPDSDQWAALAVSSNTRVGDADEYGLIYLAPGQGLMRQERQRDNPEATYGVERADREWEIDVLTVTGTAITIAAGSGWTPAVGDIVIDSSVRYAVTAFTSATAFTVDRAGMAVGIAIGYEGYTGELRWLPEYGGGPGRAKRYSAATLHCESTMHTQALTMTAQMPPIAEQAQAITLDGSFADRQGETAAAHECPEDVRAAMNADSHVGHRLRVGMRIRSADSRIRISGMTLEYQDAGWKGSERG